MVVKLIIDLRDVLRFCYFIKVKEFFMKTYDVYKKEILKNDEIRSEYDALEEEYKVMEEKIEFKQNNKSFIHESGKK